MADSNLGYQSGTRAPGSPPAVSAEDHARKEVRPMSNKEKLSAYFTIAAAALGLISDGCMKIIFIVIPTNATAFTVDQNNLMTMANVRVVVL
jgi:hypothetical protein